MRRHIVLVPMLLGILLVAAPRVAAQEIGILGGATFADITGEDAADTFDRAGGFMLGALLRIPLGQVITVQPEVQFVRKGGEGEMLDGSGDAMAKFSYIDVPVFLSVGLGPFHVLAGPTFSFEASCVLDVDRAGGEDHIDCDDDDFEGGRKSFIAGATAGAGIDLPLGPLALTIDGRYNFDLESFSESDAVEIKNEAYQLIAALRFGLGG